MRRSRNLAAWVLNHVVRILFVSALRTVHSLFGSSQAAMTTISTSTTKRATIIDKPHLSFFILNIPWMLVGYFHAGLGAKFCDHIRDIE